VIVDSQVHVWQPESPERPWTRAHEHFTEPLTYERLRGLMAAAGVDAAVLVPPSWEGDYNGYALEAARAYPQQFAVMGRLPLERPEARAALETFLEPGMLGMRVTLHPVRNAGWMTNGTLDWFWPAAQRLRIPVMVNAAHVLREIAVVAERHPELRLIIDHMGLDKEHVDDGVAVAAERTLALAKFANVSVKVSAAVTFSTQPYPYRNVFPTIRRFVETFGPQRCYWGADVSRIRATYREAVTMFTEEMDFLSSADKEWVMGRALATALGWPKVSASASLGR
jgi:predicted TIM-barrel fold metal-dependent hydrolase